MAFVFSDKYVHGFVSDAEIGAVEKEVSVAHRTLLDKSGAGADFLGWLELPKTYDRAELAAVKKAAEKIRGMCDVFVVIGIGGFLSRRSRRGRVYSRQLLQQQEEKYARYLFCRQ